MVKLKLGYSVGLPLDYNKDIPEYTTDNIKLIHKLSKNLIVFK